ncbi:MAG: beta-N-acetylhexosaminidase [Promethearchaeota archaeon]
MDSERLENHVTRTRRLESKGSILIIPEPVKLTITSGEFILNKSTTIQIDLELKKVGQYLKGLLSTSTGFENQINIMGSQNYQENAIILQIDSELDALGEEGYNLEVAPEKIMLSAPKSAGIFYGVQTLRQLLPPEIETSTLVDQIEWTVPCVKIKDYPRFSWRGFMLDEGRHFLGKEAVKRMLDLLALHKMNVFHWHLTEDQGWRIEIKRYPRLVEVGSKRKETQIGGFLSKKREPTPHSGYYTQEDIKEIVSYAAERFIKIIPEIDMPGHSMAALAAYPELSCAEGPFEVQTTFGIKKEVFCPGKEQLFTFLQNVLNEVMELFPSEIIHIGGDEVPKDRWRECGDCQTRIEKEGLKDEHELQTYFTNRIAFYLSAHGHKLMGWNEVLDDNLVDNAIAQHWLRGKNKVFAHLRKGRKFVMSRFFYCYLDYNYYLTPLRKAYAFEPIPKKLEKEYHQNVLGLEAPCWTEWIPNVNRLDWQVFPRLTAHAETGWTEKGKKDYRSFKKRLEHFFRRLDHLGVQYARKEEIDPSLIKRISKISSVLKPPLD